MKASTRALKYVKAGNLVGRWRLLSKARKAYAKYLVERYGYTAHMAIQSAYIFGYDPYPYDHRARRCVMEEFEPEHFGL